MSAITSFTGCSVVFSLPFVITDFKAFSKYETKPFTEFSLEPTTTDGKSKL